MKKIFLLLFVMAIPVNARALSVPTVRVSGPSEVKQGETSEYFIDIAIDGVSPDNLTMVFGAGVDLEYDSSVLVIEDITAPNSEVIISGNPGSREVASYFNLKEDEISYETSCSNNVFCNNYQYKLKIYAKSSGETNLKIKTIGGIFVDLNKGENITEDDLNIIENPVNYSKSINIIASTTIVPTIIPQETTKVTEEIPQTIPSVPKITTKKTNPTTMGTTESTTTSTVTTELTTKKQTTDKFEEELKADKEKRKKINKKIFSYSVMALIVIVLLVILNLIKNKIRDRKLDKELRNL